MWQCGIESLTISGSLRVVGASGVWRTRSGWRALQRLWRECKGRTLELRPDSRWLLMVVMVVMVYDILLVRLRLDIPWHGDVRSPVRSLVCNSEIRRNLLVDERYLALVMVMNKPKGCA